MVYAQGQSAVGRRKNNEDSFGVYSDIGLFVVADGLGGYAGGEIASGLVVDTLHRFFEQMSASDSQFPGTSQSHEEELDQERMGLAIRMCQREVVRHASGDLANMGSTVVAVLARRGRATIAHVGDSRVYRLRGGKLERMTRDHSLIAEMEANGRASIARKLYGSSFASMVTRSIGKRSNATPDIRTEQLQSGDKFLLCSDGLTERLTDEQIEELLTLVPTDQAVRALLQEAYSLGSHDNITAVVVEA